MYKIKFLHGLVREFETLSEADLREANLRRVNLREANLREANLRRADLREANLCRAYLREADLSEADLRGADLSRANLSRANLSGADLRGADLWGCVGDGKEIKSFQGLRYALAWTKDVLYIGCQGHSLDKWKSFTDGEIAIMDRDALEFWKEHKEFIINLVEYDTGI